MLTGSRLNKAIASLNIISLSISMILFDIPFSAVINIEPARSASNPLMHPRADKDTWVTNGTVQSIAVAQNGTTYIGGNFTYVGPNTGFGAPLDKNSAEPREALPRVNGAIRTVIPDGSGGWFIGGDFTRVGGETRNRIARILADNSVDPVFDPNANNYVSSLTVSGTTLYVAGAFTNIGGQPRNRIAAINKLTGLATSFNPGANNLVQTLLVNGSTLYAGGDFTNFGGQPRNRVAAFDLSADLTTGWNPGASATVRTLALDGSTLYVGGAFINIGGQPRNRVAAFDTVTGSVTAWNPNANSTVTTIAINGSTIYAGGVFTSMGGFPRTYLAAISSVGTGEVTAWNPVISSLGGLIVQTLVVDSDIVYIGGSFTSAGGKARNNIAAISLSTGLATDWNPNAGSSVYAIAVSNDSVYAGGFFTSIGGRTRNQLASIDASTGSVTEWNPGANNPVYVLKIDGPNLYVGGSFNIIGGQSRNRLASFNTQTGLITGWDPNLNGNVLALESDAANVYAGGGFTTVGGQPKSRLAAISKASGVPLAWDLSADGSVLTMALSGSVLYVGGQFLNIGGQPRNRAASFDTVTEVITDWDPSPNAMVHDIAVLDSPVFGSVVYIAGDFTSIGIDPKAYIAGFFQDTGLLVNAFEVPLDGPVYAMTADGSNIYIGGSFNNVGGMPQRFIASIDHATGIKNDWDPVSGGPVSQLVKHGPTLYVAGNFNLMNNEPSSYLATFYDVSPPITDINISPENPNGQNDWYISKPTTSSSTNKRAKTHYSWNSTNSYSVYTSAFEVPEGDNTLYYYSADRNNVTSAVMEFPVKVDTITPSTSLTTDPEGYDGQNGWFKTRPNINLSNSDTGDIHYSWNSTSGYSIYGSSLSGPDGTNTLYYYAKDSAGNEEGAKSRQFKIDTENPGSSNYHPANNSTGVAINASISAGLSDGLSGLDETSISGTTFYLKDSGGTTVSASVDFDSLSGTVTLKPDAPLNYLETYTAYLSPGITDLAGNAHAAHNWQFTAEEQPDIQAPAVSIVNPEQYQLISGTIQITATVDDSLSGNSVLDEAVFLVDGADPVQMMAEDGSFDSPVENVKAQLDTAILADGEHTITVLGKDSKGNWSEGETVSVHVVKYSLVSILSHPNDSETFLSGLVHVKGTAKSLSAGKFARYSVQYQQVKKADGSLVLNRAWAQILMSKAPVDDATLTKWKTFSLNGQYKLRLSVYDPNSNVLTAQRTVNIDNIKPVASPLSPLNKSIVAAADTISVKVVDDNSGIISAVLLLNDRYVDSSFNDETGILSYSPDEFEVRVGTNKVTILASDKAGNKLAYLYNFIVEPTGPIINIERPAAGQESIPGTKKTPVIGSVWSASLKSWKLEYKRISPTPSPSATVASGTKPTRGNAILGSLPTLSTGEYQLMLTSVNNGLMTTTYETTVEVSNEANYGSLTGIEDVSFGAGNLIVTGSASDPNFTSYKIFLKQTYPVPGTETLIYNSIAPVTSGVLLNQAVKGNGTYDLVLRSYNASLAVIGQAVFAGLKLDTALPKITSIYPADKSYINNQAPTMILNAVDPEPVKGKDTRSGLSETATIMIDGQYFEAAAFLDPNTYTLTNSPLIDGIHQVSYRIIDKVGNAVTREASFITDTFMPFAEISNLSNSQVLRGLYTVKGKVFDENISAYQLQYRLDSPSSSWSSAGTVKENTPVGGSTLFNWKTNALNGQYYIRLTVIDKASNKTFYPEGSDLDYRQGIKVIIDNKSPTLGPVTPKDKSFLKELTFIQVSGAYDLNPKKTGTDTTGIDSDNITIEVNGGTEEVDYNAETGKVTYDQVGFRPDGNYSAKISVPDKVGNVAVAKTTFTLDSTEPIAWLMLDRGAVKAGNKLTIVGKAVDQNIASWKLYQKLSSSGSFSLIKSGTANAGGKDFFTTLATWTAPTITGIYDLKLDVTDKAGNTSSQDLSVEVDTTSGYLDDAAIIYPSPGAIFKGKVPVIGTASAASNFAYYTLSRKLTTASAETLVYKGSAPVESGLLGTFNTPGLNGTYDLILRRFTNPSSPSQFGADINLSGLVIDNEPPVVSGISVLGSTGVAGFSMTDTPNLVIPIKETGSGVDAEKTVFYINGELYELEFGVSATFDADTNKMYIAFPGNLLEGKHTVSVSVFDKAGNRSKPVNLQLTIDTDTMNAPTLPAAAITYPAEGSYHKGSVPIVGSAFDQNLLEYTLLSKGSTTDTYSLFNTGKTSVLDATLGSFKSIGNGEHNIRLIVRDKADNIFRQSTVGIIVDNVVPVANITKINGLPISMVSQISGEVVLTGKAYDRGGLDDGENPDDSFARYVVDYGTGTAPTDWNTIYFSADPIGGEILEGQLCAWNTAGLTSGAYTLRIRAIDKAGAVKEQRKTLKIN